VELRHHATLIKAESDASQAIAWDKERVGRWFDEVMTGLGHQPFLSPAGGGEQLSVEIKPAREG
jgi:hypothetical protein